MKWCALSYEESTWERACDIDQHKIDEFEKRCTLRPPSKKVVSCCSDCMWQGVYYYTKRAHKTMFCSIGWLPVLCGTELNDTRLRGFSYIDVVSV